MRTSTVHPFPARMASGIAFDRLPKRSAGRCIILDPMSGSGTTLLAARTQGHKAIGFDSDPLALIIARTGCCTIPAERLSKTAKKIITAVDRSWMRLKAKNAFPPHCDDETREFMKYWFDLTNRKQLTCLAAHISKVRDPKLRDILWCAFSRLIIAKSEGASLARDLAHSRPHRVCDESKVRPVTHFLKAVEKIIQANPFRKNSQLPEPTIMKGDARKLPLKTASVDMVITSPPYLNAIDYVRCSKFSLVWMGYNISEMRNLRGTNVGAERRPSVSDLNFEQVIFSKLRRVSSLDSRHRGILMRYIADMNKVVSELARVTVPRGKVTFVIGNSNLKSVFINNSRIISLLANEAGLRLVSTKVRKIPDNVRYMPPPKANHRNSIRIRMREEVILSFVKSASR